MVRCVILRALARRVRRNKKRFIITFTVILFISLVTNYVALKLSTDIKVVEAFISSKANVEAVVSSEGINQTYLSRIGVVYAYIRFSNGVLTHDGRKYDVLVGDGWVRILDVSTPEHGVVVLGLPAIHPGDKVMVEGRKEIVVGSFYFPTGKPIVLYRGALGDKVYILMRVKNTTKLVSYLTRNSVVYWIAVYGKNWAPYMDVMQGLKTFFEVMLLLAILGALVLVIANSIASLRSMHKDLVALKYVGLPSSALALLSFSEYLLASLAGYFVGTPLGLYIAYRRCLEELIPPSAVDLAGTLTINAVFLASILASSMISAAYVARLSPLRSTGKGLARGRALRRGASLILVCVVVGFSMGLPLSTIILSFTPFNHISGLPCRYIIYGPVKKLSLTGDYGGYIGCGEASNGRENVTAGVYMLPINASVAPSAVSEGSWIRGEGEAVIGRGLALELGVGIGDSIYVRALATWVKYRVVGISDVLLNNGKYVFVPIRRGVAYRVLFTNEDIPRNKVSKLKEEGFIVYSSRNFREEIRGNLAIYVAGALTLVAMLTIACVATLACVAGSEVLRDAKVIAALKAIGIPDRYYVAGVSKAILPAFVLGFLAAMPVAVYLAQQLLLLVVPLPVSTQAIVDGVKYVLLVIAAVTALTLLSVLRLVKGLDVIKELRW